MTPWRIVPVRAGGGLWWIIFRYGRRMWRKPTLAEAMDYIGRQVP